MSKQQVVLAITIDTERDCSPTWHTASPLTFTSVTEGIPQRLQPLFNKYGACPTYLLTAGVMENETCLATFRGLEGSFELGTHLHGEYVEPERKFDHYAGTLSSDMQCFYPVEIEAAKLRSLTTLYEDRFGCAPLSFRAGRFAADAKTLSLLAQLGYKVDTSVTSHVIWDDPAGRLDFASAPEQPYHPCAEDICREGDLDILELPVTIDRHLLPPSPLGHLAAMSIRHIPKVGNYLLKPLWLRPSNSSARRMIAVIKRYVARYRDEPLIVLNMMFHSMEAVPGKSPYTLTGDDCWAFLDRIETVLAYCAAEGIGFARLADVYELHQSIYGG